VIFWDTSAILPLLVREEATPRAERLAREEPRLIVWWATPVECCSAIARRVREGMPGAHAEMTRAVLAEIRTSWTEILATDEVRDHANRLLGRHPLRGADALQLGAALTWANARPSGHRFATLDDRLREAAMKEGFRPAL
jgi:predicted nucleic acid-binding protein